MAPSGIVPPPRARPPKRRKDEPPRCGVCSKTLRIQDIHGVDEMLGPICRECGPHVVAANSLMYPFYI
jgi:hypothetical protein